MKSDFVIDFQPLSSRDSMVWKTERDSKMSQKMKKGTCGFHKGTDLFKMPMSLPDHQKPLDHSAWEDCCSILLQEVPLWGAGPSCSYFEGFVCFS